MSVVKMKPIVGYLCKFEAITNSKLEQHLKIHNSPTHSFDDVHNSSTHSFDDIHKSSSHSNIEKIII